MNRRISSPPGSRPFAGLTLLVLLLAGAGLGAEGPAATTGLEVRDGWARWLPGQLPAAGYLTLVNHSDRARVVTGASSPRYGLVQVHESFTLPGGVAGMRAIKELPVPAHGRVQLKPGSFHLMLMQPEGPVKLGDAVPVTLRLADGGTVEAILVVKASDGTE